MQKIHSFKDLKAWQESHYLVMAIYKITGSFPTSELYGLTKQMRRAVVSISSNIAEGFTRKSKKEKIQFYFTALASLTEIQNQILIARDVGYLNPDVYSKEENRSVFVHKLINGLIKSARSHPA